MPLYLVAFAYITSCFEIITNSRQGKILNIMIVWLTFILYNICMYNNLFYNLLLLRQQTTKS